MREISGTVTVGIGSEKHNHNLEYRDTLQHVHSRPGGVIELIPYLSYQEQINALARPFIDEYNANVEQRYQEAWERFNNGQTKTKPRKRDYKKMGYDYYTDHLHDTHFNRKTGKQEELPMFRSLIIGLGDRADRQNGTITEAEAIKTCADVVLQFRKDFPYLHLLGASLHLDEEGFYHVHLDYKPFYRSFSGQGLGFGIGHDRAFELMGLKPEQSIINGEDKVPILFNAFRNKIYHNLEAALSEHGIRLQYGVSKSKDPGKDSSKNQKLEDWQKKQDSVREMQHQKNVALELMEKDEISPDELKTAIECVENIKSITEDLNGCERSRLNKNNVVVPYNLLDQLREFLKPLYEAVGVILGEIKRLMARNKELKENYEDLTASYNELVDECNSRGEIITGLLNENEDLKQKVAKKRSLNDTIKLSEKFLDEKIHEQQ